MIRAIIISLSLVLFISCATQKSATRYITMHPEILNDFVDTTTRIEFVKEKVLIDTTIYDTIPGDTVYKDSLIFIKGKTVSGFVETATDIASAKAWIQDGRLHIKLVQNEQAIALKIDSAVAVVPKVFETQWLPSEPYLPKSHQFFKFGFFIVSGLLLFILALIFLKR